MNALRSTGALVVVAGLTVAACGGSADDAGDEPAGDVQTLTITSRDDLRFDRTTLTATPGAIRFVHENDGNLDHTFVIDGADIRLVNDDSATIELAAGEYTFYCDVAGHRSAGMEGTLTVG